MATSATNYLNGPDLQSATAVFTDATLSTKAADGWYSFGGFFRKQISGVLTANTLCNSCGLSCGSSLVMDTDQGVYNVDVNLGSSTGAVELTFDFKFVPDGVKVVYDGVTYNAIYSPNFGYIDSPGTEPLYTGVSTFNCNISGKTYPALRNYQFNGVGFNYTGSTQSVTVNPLSVFLKVSSLGNCTMVIPKLNATPATAQLTIISPCQTSDITVTAACPVALTSFNTTRATPEPTNISGLCSVVSLTAYYNLPINGFPGIPAVGDVIFQDANGATIALPGYYGINGAAPSTGVMLVDGNGVVANILACVP